LCPLGGEREFPGSDQNRGAWIRVLQRLYLANLFAAAFDVVPPPRRASAAGLLNLIGAFVSGFAGLLGGLWKQKFGVSVLMTWSGIGCLGAGLLLICAIRFWFAGDYSKVNPYEEIATA